MARWSSCSNCSLIPIILPPKTLFKALLSISYPHNFVSSSSSSTSSSLIYQKLMIINSSKSSPQLLEAASSSTSSSDNVEISNEFLRGLCKHPQSNDHHQLLIFGYYKKAKKHPKFRPEPSTLDLLINHLMKSEQWSCISTLSEDFTAFDVYPTRPTCSRLITSCIKARQFKLVDSILLGVLETNKEIAVLAFGSAMRGYNKLHMYNSTVSVFDRMRGASGVLPDAGCHLWAMDAHRRRGDTDTVLSLFHEFDQSIKNLNEEDVIVAVRIYTVLCDSLGRSGRAFEALRYMREMVAKGLTPTPPLYASLICAFAGAKEAEIARDLFQEARDKGMMVRDPAVFQKLVLMYVELGMLEGAMEVVEAMKQLRVKVSDSILCAVVNGYAFKRGLRASLKAYEQLRSSLGIEQLGQVTYASVINVYCRLGLSSKAESLFAEMMGRGFDRCVVAYSNMISMYGKAGRARDAMRLLARMKEKGCRPNVWVYNSLLDMYGRLLNLKQVEKLWKEMKRREIAADRISYTSIVSAYSRAKEFEECVKYYEEFKASGGRADRILAGIMVGVYSKSSRVNELVVLLQDLRSEGTGLDVRLYKSSLNALRDAGLQTHVKWMQNNFSYDHEEDVKDKT